LDQAHELVRQIDVGSFQELAETAEVMAPVMFMDRKSKPPGHEL
jgi:hypothetical protein